MSKITVYFGAVMVLVFLNFAFACFFTPYLDQVVQGKMKYVLGAVFLLYAVLRALRLRKQWLALKSIETDPS